MGVHSASRIAGLGTVRRAERVSAHSAGLGALALAVAIGASSWIAVGVAAGPRWLELPTPQPPSWVYGPLHRIAGAPISEPALGAALLVLSAAYLVALACARSISPRAALAAVALAGLAFTLAPTILSSDVFGYVAYARELGGHGLNPYVSPPSALGHDALLALVYWKHEPSPYGPLFTLAAAPLGRLSPAAALWTFKASAGLALVAGSALAARIAPRRGLDPARAAIFVGLNPVVLFYGVSGAHNDLIAALLVTGALGLAVGGPPGAGAGGAEPPSRGLAAGAGALAVAAGAIKVTLGLGLPFVLILARRRGRAALGGTALGLLAIGISALALFGTHLFDQLQRITTDARFDIAWSGPDLLARALTTHITAAIRAAATGAAAAVTVAMLVRAWRGADPVAAAGWAGLALLASIASLAPWYLAWLLPLAALGRSRGLAAAALLATGCLLAVHLPLLGGHPWLSAP